MDKISLDKISMDKISMDKISSYRYLWIPIIKFSFQEKDDVDIYSSSDEDDFVQDGNIFDNLSI